MADAAIHRMMFGEHASFFNRTGTPASHPEVRITKILSRVDQTRAGFSATLETLLEGMALAAFVVWLFLRDWRATAVTAIAMPVALIPTFAFMSARSASR